jgi:hypothetical protein
MVAKVALHVTSNLLKKIKCRKGFFKKTYGIALTFSNIKLNETNEITAILVNIEDKAGVKKHIK